MRRLLAILLLTSPAVVLAQTSGQVLFSPDATLNAAECESTTTTVSLTWQIKPDTSFSAGGTVDVWVANRESSATTSPYCLTTDGVDGLQALQIANDLAAPAAIPSTALAVSTSDLASVTSLAACSAGTAYAYVCIEWRDVDGTPDGYARGTVTLKLERPNAPTVTSVRAGEEALHVGIKAATTGEEATEFRAKAVAADLGLDAATHYSPWDSEGTVRIGGLLNDVAYTVTAFGRSEEGNVSDESAAWAVDVAPEPVEDAWEHYDGQDSGGCQAGAAGLGALLGAAALLRLRRRS